MFPRWTKGFNLSREDTFPLPSIKIKISRELVDTIIIGNNTILDIG